MAGFVYVLSLTSGKYYIGSTTDIARRLKEHNNKKVISTKNHGPVTLKYMKQCENIHNARILEKHIKSMKSRRFIEGYLRDVK